MKKSFERYIKKMSQSKKVHDYLAMRKKRCRSKSCSLWPSSGNENIDDLTENSFTVTTKENTLIINFIAEFNVKEYGLYVLDPIKYSNNNTIYTCSNSSANGEQKADNSNNVLIGKIALASAEEGEVITVKKEVKNIELYQGRFYVYVISSKGKIIIKRGVELVRSYTVTELKIATSEMYSFCEQQKDFEVALVADGFNVQ